VLLVGLSIVPGVSWVWKLGLIVAIANGFEMLRAKIPFEAPVPKRLGMAAVITGWVPGLNVYVAPFLWEMFASRTETVIHQLMASRASST
jgi:lipid A disaccharide synthetase